VAQVLGYDIESFRAEFGGTVLTERDDGYDTARSLWNGAIDRRPAVIARCATPEQVATAISFARANDLELSVRGGGHNFAGFACTDHGLMIDLSPMRSVRVDAERRVAFCGGGATWADVDAATQEHGLAVTGGFVSHTGVAGLTLGGGIGWLTRAMGLSCDSLAGAELVAADGSLVRADADHNPELFWALRGGGGNFGVVTSFEFALRPTGPMADIALFFWEAARGAEALAFCREFVRTVPDDYGILVAGLSAPPAPFVPEEHHFAVGYALIVVGFTSSAEHAAVIAPVREALPPLFEMVSPIPYVALQQMFDAGNPWGTLAYEKALHLEELTDEAIAVITEHFPRRSSPLSFMPVFVVDGAYGKVADDATAYSGLRSTRYVVNIAAICPAPELYEADRPWVRSFWEALRPHAVGPGSYVNFMSEYDEDRVRAAYGPQKYQRLQRVKAEWDPENLFRLNANVKPAGG
jgi:FAD binding domain/Berberine and berberine like